jgi:hypothetical protein
MSIVKRSGPEIIERLVPYDLRSGRIKGKYVLKKVMSQAQRKRVLELYRRHEAKNLRAKDGCSLNEYLETAAICYRAAYGRKVKDKTPLEMYHSFADGRHGGMLDIKDRNSRKEFARWYESGAWAGSHPSRSCSAGSSTEFTSSRPLSTTAGNTVSG